MVQDHGRPERACEFSHPRSTGSLVRLAMYRLPPAVDEQLQIVAAEDEDALGRDVKEVGLKVVDVDEGMLLGIDRVGLSRPADDFAGGGVEHRHEFCVGAGGRARAPTAVVATDPLLLLRPDVEIDA